MKKLLSLSLLVTTCLAMLTGCSGSKAETGTLSLTVSVQKNIYDTLRKAGVDPFKGQPVTTTTTTVAGKPVVVCNEEYKDISFSDAEAKLRSITLYSSSKQPVSLMQSVELQTKGGLFYTSSTFQASTGTLNNAAWSADISLTMPGRISQVKGGSVQGQTVRFHLGNLTQENDLAAYSESNNVGAVLIIILVLLAAVAGFFLLTKRDA